MGEILCTIAGVLMATILAVLVQGFCAMCFGVIAAESKTKGAIRATIVALVIVNLIASLAIIGNIFSHFGT